MNGELVVEWSSSKHGRQGVPMEENDLEMERNIREVRPALQKF